MVKEKQHIVFSNIQATDIQLFKVSLPVDDDLDGKLGNLKIEQQEELKSPVEEISGLFEDPPAKKLHLLVHALNAQSKRPRPLSQQSRSWPQKRQNIEIPALEHVAAFLKAPLSELEKVPVSKREFRRLVHPTPGHDYCTEKDALSVFRIDDDDDDLTAQDGWPVCFVSAVVERLPISESNFISAWDRNIRFIVERCVPYGTSFRNSNSHTATRDLRPDYGFLIRKTCPFRGEEKGPENTADPREELSEKLIWMYKSTPYVLAYHASGTSVSLVALAPSQVGLNPVIHNLVTTDIQWRKDRINNILHLINLSALLTPLSQLMEPSGAEFDRLERRTCTIDLTSFVIIKTYQDSAKVKHLRGIYDLLREYRVPNVDRLSFASGNTVHLAPRGVAVQPRTKQELHECVRCVLEALVVLHRIPLYHRDIRPENVIKRIEDPSRWFLIDWEDASGPETVAQPYFMRETHSPDIFHDNHGAEVDIWGVAAD
ncbi:hypothetical protein FA15DRAFT_300792 [Coprinopsis marcescibilis]|uniref:Protein kinase domain-containing protein n=1 Tax=Coprinopsis marcescibilis TaxID=230819 RepID=A0A5C3KDM2_COPMA|nr:hypothetical protein FA15DRAFT_300792 [Coprinopsis marcescibilis]